jgi:hypothetical protein
MYQDQKFTFHIAKVEFPNMLTKATIPN